MTITGYRTPSFSPYSLQRTSHDIENNRKMMLVEKNQSVLSWVVSQPPPYAQKKSARCRRDSPGAARSHYTLWKRVSKSDILSLTKEAVLICDSTGRSEILGEIPLIVVTGPSEAGRLGRLEPPHFSSQTTPLTRSIP